MLVLLYGIFAYLIFVGTFCYTVGFITGLVVPKHIDSMPHKSLGFALVADMFLLLQFALQHSVMARPVFKARWTQFVFEPIERSTYVLMASLCLLLLFWMWQPVGGIIWQAESEALVVFLQSLCLFGFGIVLVSTFLINHFDLFGLRQVWLYFSGKEYVNLPFRTPFFYKHVRHPLYVGFIIAFWSAPVMTAAHLFFSVMTTVYILVAIQFEENDLVNHFGETYSDYKRSAPMLVPFAKRRAINDKKVKSFGEKTI